MARIFEPFQTTKSFGTGLGLAVVSAMVADAGGSIHVRSTSHGTMFQVVWPLAHDGLPRKKDKHDASSPVLDGARILIVDDNPSVLDLIASEVRKTKAEVTAVLGPIQALETLEGNTSGWDAVVLDFDMPEMNGAQLATRIRENWPHLKIILCTALTEIEMSVAGSLFDDRITKSEISSSLNYALERLLSGSKIGVS